MNKKTPVLFIIFNRPDKAIESFGPIKRYKPERLYLAADGPRQEKPGEKELCKKTRDLILSEIDWPCDIRKKFRDENAGCGRSVFEAITWMFEDEESGIIIEDDCIVSNDFFWFCEELLYLYKDDDRIAEIDGFNEYFAENKGNTYYFTGYPANWGWATWRRAWVNIDFKMELWPEIRFNIFKRFNFLEACIHLYGWERLYRSLKHNLKPDAWDFQWAIYIYMQRKLCIKSCVNMVQNVGFGKDSTHSNYLDHSVTKIGHGKLLCPLEHPTNIAINVDLEKKRTGKYIRYYIDLLFRKLTRIFKHRKNQGV